MTPPRPYGAGQCGACSPASASAAWRFSSGSAATSATAAAISGALALDLGEVDTQAPPHPGLRQRGDAAQPALGAAEEPADAMGPAQVQMRVMLPGAADAAEHLDAVLDVCLRGGDADARGQRRGDRELVVIPESAAARAASAAATSACSARHSISAHRCLTAWKLPIGLPNCSRTLA